MGLLDGKVAIITGAGGGIGRQHALSFAREGAKVVVNDLGGTRHGEGDSTSMADAVVQEIRAAGGEAAASYDSVAGLENAQNIVKTAIEAFGQVDVLVNNAGILRDKSFKKMTWDMWCGVLSVHLAGTFACSNAVFRHLAERSAPGSIINTTSVSGMVGNFGQANYAAAKAGIYGLTRTIAIEGHRGGIRANAIAPVAFTRMTKDLPMFEGKQKSFSPEAISPVAVYLASDLSEKVTGKIFGVEGGEIFEWKMASNQGRALQRDVEQDGFWTPREIAENLGKILASDIPDPAVLDTQGK